MTTTTVETRRTYTVEEKELALHVLALTGTKYEYATKLLSEQGLDLPKQTLWNWANHALAPRFEEIKAAAHQEIANRVATQAEQVMLKAGDLEELMIAFIHADVLAGNIPPKDLPGALKNVSTTKALNNDKISSPIRGRPTVIHADRTADEIMRALKALEPNLIVEGTAHEVQKNTSEARSIGTAED